MVTKFEMQFDRDRLRVTYVEYQNRAVLEVFNDYTPVTDRMNTDVSLTYGEVEELIDKLTLLKQSMKV